MKKYIPILDWLPNYNLNTLKGDFLAGLMVAIILIPQGIAYATIAKLPPVYGLYTALIPLIVYTFFGSSRKLAVGPIAVDSIIIAASISALAKVGTEHYISLVILLTFLVGIIQLIVGVFKLGFVINFLSKPVINGFIMAAAIIITVNQLSTLFGVNGVSGKDIFSRLINLFKQMPNMNRETILIGVFSLTILFFLKRINKKIPGALIVVFFGILYVSLNYEYLADKVPVIGTIPNRLPSFRLPEFSYQLVKDLIPYALTVAFIGFVQAMSISKVLEENNENSKLNSNQELIALGLGNIAGSFFSSYTSTGSFARSAVNKDIGAKTPLSNLFSAVFVALILLFLTPVLFYLPKTVVAAIIITAVIGFIKIDYLKHLWKSDKSDFLILAFSFLVTLIFGVTNGIFASLLASLFIVLYKTSRPHMAVLGKIPGEHNFYRNIDRFPEAETTEDAIVIRFDSQLYYANAQFFRDKIDEFAKQKGEKLQLIVIDASVINSIDSTGIFELEQLIKKYNKRGIQVFIANIKGPVRDLLAKSGFVDRLGLENFFLSIQDALDCYRTGDFTFNDQHKKYLNQSNL